jgi:hypothetical protein
MLMKIISLVMSFVMGRAAHANANQTSFLLNMATMATLRRIGMLTAGAISGLLLFLGGFFTILVDMVLATRAADQLSFSQASLVGFSLIIISFLVELALFSRGNWEPVVVHNEEETQAKEQPVAEALAELIRDFTMERKVAREQRSEQLSTATATSSPTAAPAYN